MRMRLRRTLQKSKSKNPRWLGNLKEKLKHGKNIAHFSTSNNNLLTMEPNQIQTYSNPAIRAEVEQQQRNGLIYTNITKFR